MLFPSTLITCRSPEPIADYLRRLTLELKHSQPDSDPDVFILDDYTINCVRSLKHFLSRKPYNHPHKIIIIPQANLLHLEAQNALLKVLEEPGDNNYLILTSSKPHRLLPTITSRCHLIRLTSANSLNSTLHHLTLDTPLPADKSETLSLLELELAALHQQLLKQPSTQLTTKITAIVKAINMIESNVDPRAAVDYYLLS